MPPNLYDELRSHLTLEMNHFENHSLRGDNYTYFIPAYRGFDGTIHYHC